MLKKMDLKKGVILCTLGVIILGVGSINEKYLTIRLAGVIVITGGLITVGKRFYEGFQERIREKRGV